MKILLDNAGKRYNREWIFRHFNYTFEQGQSYAIIGPNGSGKSTLLQVLCGAVQHNEGIITWSENGEKFTDENIFKQVSICAPYLDLVEEMTLFEFLNFHQQFKKFIPGFDTEKIIATLGLQKARDKQIRYFSSGMKQRVKLAQCVFSDVPVIFLDEPCTNFDQEGVALYQQLIEDHCQNKMLVVSSNDQQEFGFCLHQIKITDYK
jgi:ABC-type multidrug transport system ATPase subunit